MDLSATEEASLGLAHALFTGHPVAGPVVGALKSVLQGVLAVRVSLVDKTGLYLLNFPVVEAGEVVKGSLKATAKCKEGTAAWTAFQTSHVLSSWQLLNRSLKGSPMPAPLATRPGGFTCLDWTELKHNYKNSNIVTVPIEAPEGVLGALTGAAGPEKSEQDLTSEMQALSKSLAHSLTFCKCKSDLQAAVALLQRVCPTEDSSGLEPGSSSEATTNSHPLPAQAAACISAAASSCESFSDAAEGFSESADMRHYHPPRLGPQDSSLPDMAPAERYCKWIHHNVHGQEQHSLARLTKSDTPIQIRAPTPSSGMTRSVWGADSALGGSGNSQKLAACSEAGSAKRAGMQDSCAAASIQNQHQGVIDQSKLCTPGPGHDSNWTGEGQRPQQPVTAQNCCGGAPCGQWADIWAAQTFGGDIRTLGIETRGQYMYLDTLTADMEGTRSEAVSMSGSEQISSYEPVWHRNRSSMSSEWANSRTSLGSPRDWQEDSNGDGFSEQPNEDTQPLPQGRSGQPMLRLSCGESGCRTCVWLRPDQLGLEPVDLRSVDLQHVDLQPVELASVSVEELHGQQAAQARAAGRAPGQPSAQQSAGNWTLQHRSASSAPSLHEWSTPRQETPAETHDDAQVASPGARRPSQHRQHCSVQPKHWILLEQWWDLTFRDDHLERRFVERFNGSMLLTDKAHCVLLILLMMFGITRSLTLDSQFTAPWVLASGLLALVAAAQLAVLQGSFAALQCREQLASAERLIIPALALFFYLSQAPAQSQGFLMYYLSGWASLAYLALARRLRLRAHLLLVMPELCMQATACLAGLLGRQSSLERVPPSFQGAQVLAAMLVPTAAVYILEQQARWRFLLAEIKGRM